MFLSDQDRLCQEVESALRRIILRYPERSQLSWQRRYGSIEEYLDSVECNRERWAALLRAPDEWQQCAALEITTTTAREKKISLTLAAGVQISAIYIEPGPAFQPPYPLVVFLHGVDGSPEMVMGRLDSQPPSYQAVGLRLAEQGFAVLAPRMLNTFPQRNRINRMALLLSSSVWGLEVQAIRQLLAQAIPRLPVDKRRIGLWGLSMGGGYGLFLLPLEPSFQAGILSAWFNQRPAKMVVEDPRYSCFLPTDEEHAFLPSLLDGFSDCDLASLICPRPLLIQTGDHDPVSWPALVEQEFLQAKTHYQKLGVEERIQWDHHSGGHEVRIDSGIAFLQQWIC